MSECYYGVRIRNDGDYEGIVYSYDDTGSHTNTHFVSDPIVSKERAMDVACEWAEDNGFDRARME